MLRTSEATHQYSCQSDASVVDKYVTVTSGLKATLVLSWLSKRTAVATVLSLPRSSHPTLLAGAATHDCTSEIIAGADHVQGPRTSLHSLVKQAFVFSCPTMAR